MKREYEAMTTKDGRLVILFKGKDVLFITTSTKEGQEFIDEYINDLEALYPNHLKAIKKMLKLNLGNKFSQKILDQNYYKELIVCQSLSCCAGSLKGTPIRDKNGKYNFRYTLCPCRKICPFNGYNINNKNNKLVICNPILYTGLTNQELKLADKLINSALTLEEIAAINKISINTAKTHLKHIYKKLDIKSRSELFCKLSNQRILL